MANKKRELEASLTEVNEEFETQQELTNWKQYVVHMRSEFAGSDVAVRFETDSERMADVLSEGQLVEICDSDEYGCWVRVRVGMIEGYISTDVIVVS